MPIYDEVGPTPVKRPFWMELSDLLHKGREKANEYEIHKKVPLIGGTGVGDFLLGDAEKGAERIALDLPLFKGKNQTLQLQPDVLDLGLAGSDAVSLAGLARKPVQKALTTAARNIDVGPTAGTRAAQYGRVKVKGGDKAADAAETAADVEKATVTDMPVSPDEAPVVTEKLRQTEQPRRAVQAPREVKVGKRFKTGEKAGIYRGTEAFGGITPQKATAMRAAYIKDVEAGAPYSKYWYDDTSKVIYDLTGGDIPRADNLAHALSVTSSSTGVPPNSMYGFKAWNQDLVGDPVRVGQYPTRMSADIVRGWSGEDVKRGLKRDPYKAGLSVHWRPDPDLRPTNDIHQMRAWGIRDPKTGGLWKKGVGEAGHRFIDEQTGLAAKEMNQKAIAAGEEPDWLPYRVQASAWSPQRVKTGQAASLEEAGKHYGDFVDEYSGLVTREWTPGATTGHLPESLSAPLDVRDEYARAMEQAVSGRLGIDKLASDMGTLSAETIPNRGVYEGVVNPGYTSRIPVGKAHASDAIDPSSAKALDAVAGGHGLVGVQDQSAWNFLGGDASNRDIGGFRLERGRQPFSNDELERLAQRLREVDAGVDIPQADPRGARVLHFDDPYGAEARELQQSAQAAGVSPSAAKKAVGAEYKAEDKMRKALVAKLQTVAPEFDAKLSQHERSWNLFPLKEGSTWEKPDTWSAKPFIEKVEAGGPKMAAGFDRSMQTVAPQLLQTTEQFAAKYGWTAAPWYRPMMEALGSGGLAALKELVRQGIVPVTVLSVLAGIWGGGEDQDQGAM